MESEARYTLVGATIVALVFAGVAAIFWLKSSGGRENVDRYTIYFQRQSLDGLQVGAEVTMLGIGVGRVEGYVVDMATMNRVRVTIRVSDRAPVTPVTTAIVQRNILTGIARIALSPPPKAGDVQPHTVVPPGAQYPVIAEGTSDLEQITDTASRLAKSGALALDNVNNVLSTDNRAAIDDTLANVRNITAALDARMDQIDTVTLALARTAADVGRASRDVAESVRLMQGAATPAVGQAEATLRDVSRSVERFEREAANVAQRIDTAVELGSLELSATSRELRATSEILARTIDRIRSPRTLLLAPSEQQLGPGERLQ
jgi:phospholipid/cholesterol/gamma-HCH transport system substrate-binding protein